MPDRIFDKARNPVGDNRTRYKLDCCRCGVTTTVNTQNGGGLPSQIIEKKFVEKGWSVGHDNKHDLCPAHVKHPPRPVRDPEPPLVERIDKSIQQLESSLSEFLRLEQPRSHEKVIGMLNEFHQRVFGSPAA